LDDDGAPIARRFVANELFLGHAALAEHRAIAQRQALTQDSRFS